MRILMKRIFLGVTLAGLLAVAPAGFAQGPGEVGAAQHAEADWLGLVDAGDFSGSWRAAAKMIQSAVTEGQWETAMNGVRVPLGKVLNRTLKDSKYATTLPGVPDGEYVVCVYETSFEHKQAARETVTATLEKDGHWRVAGYFIK